MDISLLLSFAVIGGLTAAVLRKYRTEYALFAGLAAAMVCMAAALSAFAPVLNILRQLSSVLPDSGEYLTVLLKCAGTAILAETASGICIDCGETTLSKISVLAGKIGILIAALPLFTSLAEEIFGIISG